MADDAFFGGSRDVGSTSLVLFPLHLPAMKKDPRKGFRNSGEICLGFYKGFPKTL